MPMQNHNHKSTMENFMEPAETDQSGSLHFEAPNKEDTDAPPEREHKVSFNSRVRCRRSKPSQRNPESSWYSKDEIASFRKRDKHVQSLISTGTFAAGIASFVGDNDAEEVSFVGLLSRKERKQRLKRVPEAQSCVLDEQMRQEQSHDGSAGSFELDQESVSDFYSIYSRRATKVAYMKGLQVSWHVENLWEEEATDSETSHRSCSQRSSSQRSQSTSGHRPERNSSLRSTGSLLARLTTATA
ncbi:MAG: hypothetical protein SGBAC_010219 [Bacillariaceae sp.]